MLKKSTRNMNCVIDPAANGMHCYYEDREVYDSETTQANREQCRLDAQAIIDEIDLEIEKYTTLKADLTAKQTDSDNLLTNFNKGNELLSQANVNANLDFCKDCVDHLNGVFTEMLQKCDSKLTELDLKKQEAEDAKEACATDDSLKAYKTVSVRVCNQYTQ